jgi:hypothetical protein
MGYTGCLTDYLRASDAKTERPFFSSASVLLIPKTQVTYTTLKFHFSPQNCSINILQTLDQEITRSFKHYYYKQLEIKSISMTDHNKLLHVRNTHKSKCFGCTIFHCRIMMLRHTYNNCELFPEM